MRPRIPREAQRHQENIMKMSRKIPLTALLATLSFAASAQVTGPSSANTPGVANGTFADRNVEQQRRIEQGLRSGDLTVQEASRLEREESRVNRMESRALRDGTMSDAERARINNAQDRVSQDIARERQDSERGNPNSASSRRMQADVQRNVSEQERIARGMNSGQLTNREAGRLENGQARTERMEARAGADGHIGRYEQRGIQRAENQQSRHIYNERHDNQARNSDDHRRYGNHGDNNFRRDINHRQAWQQPNGYRHDRGFRSAPQHSYQPRYFAQAGGRRFR
jgi:hypothetical protein